MKSIKKRFAKAKIISKVIQFEEKNDSSANECDFDNQKGGKDKKEEEEKKTGGSGIAEVSISKHRNGATGVVKLVFLKEYGLFSNYSKVEE